MIKKEIITQSKWKENLKHDYLSQESDTIVIMLPGNGYTVQGPLFYYLTGMYLEIGYDILQVNYGHQLSQEQLDFKDIEIVFGEVKKATTKLPSYENVIIIGKSMGTAFIDILARQYTTVTKIYLTPTDKTLTLLSDDQGLFIYGTKDPLLKNRDILASREVMMIEDANHSLIVGQYKTDLENMIAIVDRIKAYSASQRKKIVENA